MWNLLFGSTARNELVNKILEYNQRPLWSNTPQGWECPKCGSVYAPYVAKCGNCNHSTPKVTTASTKDF